MAIHTRPAPPLNTALTYITYIKGTLLMQDAPLCVECRISYTQADTSSPVIFSEGCNCAEVRHNL